MWSALARSCVSSSSETGSSNWVPAPSRPTTVGTAMQTPEMPCQPSSIRDTGSTRRSSRSTDSMMRVAANPMA